MADGYDIVTTKSLCVSSPPQFRPFDFSLHPMAWGSGAVEFRARQ
jgi:hypothetical protein